MTEHVTEQAFAELNERFINLVDSFSALSTLSALDIRYPDLQTMLRKALRGLMEYVDMERCSVFLLQDERLVNCVGLDWEDFLAETDHACVEKPYLSCEAAVGEGVMGLAVKTRVVQHSRDCADDSRFRKYPGQAVGSLISVPLVQPGGDVLGVLNISHSLPNFFNEWHERFLRVYCNCLGQLIANHRLVSMMDREIEKRSGQLVRALDEARGAEKELRESKDQLNLVLEGSNDGFWDWSLVTGAVRLSPRWAAMLGYGLAEIDELFQGGANLIHPDDARAVNVQFVEHLRGAVDQYAMEYRLLTKSGEWKWILDRGKVVERDHLGRPLRMTGTTTDVSDSRSAAEEKRRLEEQLHHSQKMEAVGQLAGGVAHEFNNIMTAIIGYGHLLVMKTEEYSTLQHYATQILTSAERAAGLTRSLLTFSRKQITNPHHVNVNETIEKIGKLLSRLIREDIEFRTELCKDRLTVLADDGQLEQVLMNLVTNARDAMPQSGVVTIRTTVEALDLEDTTGEQLRLRDYACISVIDTGIGMDAATREKIFEPFFTTKEPGKGTGLGLAIVYGLIKQQNGHVKVSSTPGKGTVFSIFLPLVQEEGRQRDTATKPVLRKGTETVLVAEDDDDVRRLDREILEECGYTVIEAANGQEALNRFVEFQDTIDLLMFDVIMPKMNGREVYEEIRKMQPAMPILFTSGYAGDILNSASGIGTEYDFVAKPLPPEELLEKVREILDRPRH
jgi:PAS domain S-box-containing protein